MAAAGALLASLALLLGAAPALAGTASPTVPAFAVGPSAGVSPLYEEPASFAVVTAIGDDRGYSGESATVRLKDTTPSQEVSLRFDGSPLVLSGECTTDAKGGLSQFGEEACTFTVPAGSVGSSVPVEVTIGLETLTVSFEITAAPSLTLAPSSGGPGTVIEVKSGGLPGGESFKITFTPAGAGAPSASVYCATNGLGEIVSGEGDDIGKPCELTVPEGTPPGEATVAAIGTNPSTDDGQTLATARFMGAAAKLEGIEVFARRSEPGGGGAELYVGEAASLTILGVYSTGTAPLAVPEDASPPTLSWATPPAPSAAIGIVGVSDGYDIQLTANDVTSSPGLLRVQYEGFEATEKLNVVRKPCPKCFYVNSALLKVHAEAPGPSSTPVPGATADIAQGLAGEGGITTPPPCIPETTGSPYVTGCGPGYLDYPEVPESAAFDCTTEGAGECLLLAEEGTVETSAREVEDEITLSPPPGYEVTGVEGCSSVSGPAQAPVCHMLLPEYSEPREIAFTLKAAPPPVLTVAVTGPEIAFGPSWLNQQLDGAVATITPTGATPGSPVGCEVEGGEEASSAKGEDSVLAEAGQQASCAQTLAPGTYQVSLGPSFATAQGSFDVTSANPLSVELKPGENVTVGFETAFAYSLRNEASGESTTPSTPAQTSDGPLTATATGGTGAVTVGQYASDPVGAPSFSSAGGYFDVLLSQASSFTSLSFSDCELGGGTGIFWWNPAAGGGDGAWEPVSDETAVAGTPGCITVTIDEHTTPNLAQMTGTVFGVALAAASTSTPTPSTPATTATGASSGVLGTKAASASVSLDGSILMLQRSHDALVKLGCTGDAACTGKLTLTAISTTGKGRSRHTKKQTIGTASFSIPPGKTATITLALNSAGRALLKGDHGPQGVSLTVLKRSPAPSATHTYTVHLAQRRARKANQGTAK